MPRKLQPINHIHWVMVLLVMSIFTLLLQGPAWGGEFKIESHPNGIRGYAQQVALEEIMSYLAHTNGYVVQIDPALLDTPTTFHFPTPLPAEVAIQRIVHPHSLALIFTREPGKAAPVIRQIKVFDKGKQSASYATLSANSTRPSQTDPTRSGAVRSDSVGKNRVQAGPSAVHKYVRPPVTITKSAMGFSGFTFKDRRRGPDYRPNAMAMAQMYADYRAERDTVLDHIANGKLNSAKQTVEQEKNQYRDTRTSSLQQTINDSTN